MDIDYYNSLFGLAGLIISFMVSYVAYTAFDSIDKNPDSTSVIVTNTPVIIGLIEVFLLVILIFIFKTPLHGDIIAAGVTLNSFVLSFLAYKWMNTKCDHPEKDIDLIGYFGFTCIEIFSIVLIKKLFENVAFTPAIMCINIGLNVVSAGLTGRAFFRASSRNPALSNKLFTLTLIIIGMIDVSGFAMVGRLFV